ncbi:MAG: efflux RND transporter periplasmic adaptor subunit [Flavobacteriales bacterium]|nr:efflux RND transporter periplasmic adaptor subunit [Flavobacteriales bacterium]
MKNTIAIIALFFLAASCQEAEPEEQQVQEEETVETTVEKVAVSNDSIIECTGNISVAPESRVSIHSPIGGIVKSVRIMEGEQVKKGQQLAVLEHLSIIQLQEDYLAAKSQYEFEQKNYERKSKLYKQEVISDKEIDLAKQAFQSAQAHFEGLKTQLSFLGISLNQLAEGKIRRSIPIRSPISGSVVHVAAKNGQYAAQDTQLFGLMDDAHKHVELEVFAADANRVKEGQIIRLRTADDSETVYEATVFLIGKSIDPGSNSIRVHGELLTGKDVLITGTAVFAEILTD